MGVWRGLVKSGYVCGAYSFKTTIKKTYSTGINVALVVAANLVEAGITSRDLDLMALDVIEFGTKRRAELSFITGISDDIAMMSAVPAVFTRHSSYVMCAEQKLAYACNRDASRFKRHHMRG